MNSRTNFVILRRTKAEKNVFGGEVYLDIDGKNIGIVDEDHIEVTLSLGVHTIKMYKSHTMGTFIGNAETEIEIMPSERLCARYTPPLMINQPGHIIITQFHDLSELEVIVNNIENTIRYDYAKQQVLNEVNIRQSRKNDTRLLLGIFVVPIMVGLISWLFIMNVIW